MAGVELERRLGPRADRARATRRRIVEAALRLFVEQGYQATTMSAIAREAGVAVQTLYLAFGSKARLLAAALDVAVVGDDAPVPLMERAWAAEFRAEADGPRAVAILCREVAQVLSRVGPLHAAIRAATGDADVARFLEADQRRRYGTLRDCVAILASKSGFDTALGEERAADIVYGVLSEALYLLLRRDCGWTLDEWTAWCAATLSAQLFPAPAAATGPT